MLSYMFFRDRIFKTFKINVKIFNLFVFIVPYNVLLYLPNNLLLYLALIRPLFFWYSSYCQAKLNQNNNQKNKTRGATRMKIFS